MFQAVLLFREVHFALMVMLVRTRVEVEMELLVELIEEVLRCSPIVSL